MNHWDALKFELHREARVVLFSTGEFVSVVGRGDSEVLLCFGMNTMKVTHVPERSAVKWETAAEYAFEKLKDQPELAMLLLRKVRRQSQFFR